MSRIPLQRKDKGMAEASQEVMTFESEEARSAALDAFDEKTGNVEDLQKIRNAEIKAPEPEPKEDITPPPEPEPEEEPEPKEPESKEPEPEPEPKKDLPHEFVIKRDELPERFRDKNPNEVFKSHKEQDDLIKRQGEKIQEMQSQLAQGLQKSVVAESDLQIAQKDAGIKPKPAEDDKDIPESQLSKIMALQEELTKLDDPFDERAIAINRELIPLQNQEIMRTNMIANKANNEAQSLRSAITEYQNRQDESSLAERNKVELKKLYEEMDEFSKMDEYKDEYGMSISAAKADQKYVDWRNQVALQYYGMLPNDSTEEGKEQLNYAMYMLKQRSPDLIEKLRVANIPTEPDADLKSYVKLCELLDERDCIRYDPVERKTVQITRFNPKTGKYEPVSFPTLKATIEHKRVESGYYKDKMLEANKKGAKSYSDALTKRDTKELENDTGSAAEVQLSIEQANKVLDEFDLEAAGRKYYQTGDPSVFNEYNAARRKAGQPIMDLTNVPTLNKNKQQR